ncbi:MAG: hypothetical protein AAGJ12_07185 [Bacteroidota bacterium]
MVFLLVYSCAQKSEEKKTSNRSPKTNQVDSTSTLKTTSYTADRETPIAKRDSVPTHIFKSGETLWNLCRNYYGNRHYSKIVASYNRVEDVRNISDGTPIKIPELEDMFHDEKLGLTQIHAELGQILEARKLFMKHEKTLYDLREDIQFSEKLSLPEVIQADLGQAISLTKQATTSLSKFETDTTSVPVKTMKSIKRLTKRLTNLSEGQHDGRYGYDLDMVHQELVRLLQDLILWGQTRI